MQKGYLYIMLMLGLMLGFYLFGVSPDTSATGFFLDLMINHPQDIFSGSLWLKITLAIGAAALASTFLGFAVKNVELAMMWGVWATLSLLFWDFTQVFWVIYTQFNIVIALVVFTPPMILWVLTILEIQRGRD